MNSPPPEDVPDTVLVPANAIYVPGAFQATAFKMPAPGVLMYVKAPPGFNLTVFNYTQPPGGCGSVTVAPDGKMDLIPAGAFVGTCSFNFTVLNEVNEELQATVVFNVGECRMSLRCTFRFVMGMLAWRSPAHHVTHRCTEHETSINGGTCGCSCLVVCVQLSALLYAGVLCVFCFPTLILGLTRACRSLPPRFTYAPCQVTFQQLSQCRHPSSYPALWRTPPLPWTRQVCWQQSALQWALYQPC